MKRFILKLILASFLCGLFNPASLWAWGPDAHRIIGAVADLHLRPVVRSRLKDEYGIAGLYQVADWADSVRKKRRQGPWHYVNIAPGERLYLRSRDCGNGDCVVEKINEFFSALSEQDAPLSEISQAVKYLVHLVGDAHQPLHAGNRDDRGGNFIKVEFKGRETNLHALWDSGLLPRSARQSRRYAETLNQQISVEDRAEWIGGGPEDWVNESRAMALDHAYTATGRLTKRYIQISMEMIDLRLSQAGIRLADLLNRCFE
ncbi:MAG: S1/P1 nuclease [Candidatus Nitrohelix vancouverensis]|uniref:S1/P1 nuclease n=1 Tax=Candidatus Nitrohelix vancouverensis TaxID=2705534 RepID=A0A7T0C348_9BACT|nr:MAG: S1/P1 nuclease [Candidatus Nitrohelix vancouverensis]